MTAGRRVEIYGFAARSTAATIVFWGAPCGIWLGGQAGRQRSPVSVLQFTRSGREVWCLLPSQPKPNV